MLNSRSSIHSQTASTKLIGAMPITLDEVRRRILIAMVSDDQLMNTLVLKGGNALALVHAVGKRASLDMDFSIATQFPDLADAKARIFRSLRREFAEVGYVLIDEEFVPKPTELRADQPEWWGGYFIEFKLVARDIYNSHSDNLDTLRRQAAVLGPGQRRKYTIDISKNEYCASKIKKTIDDYVIYVYSLEMIAIEKLRAICQQMPQYATTRTKTPRARDFYDIHEITRQPGVDLNTPGNREIFRHIFAAKHVPLELLGEIHKYKGYHEPDWPAVEASISGEHQAFDHYFNRVVELVSQFHSLWVK
jgi:predicted nucleotidyltransferase component of viral defense system